MTLGVTRQTPQCNGFSPSPSYKYVHWKGKFLWLTGLSCYKDHCGYVIYRVWYSYFILNIYRHLLPKSCTQSKLECSIKPEGAFVCLIAMSLFGAKGRGRGSPEKLNHKKPPVLSPLFHTNECCFRIFTPHHTKSLSKPSISKSVCGKGRCRKLLSGFFALRGYPPPLPP